MFLCSLCRYHISHSDPIHSISGGDSSPVFLCVSSVICTRSLPIHWQSAAEKGNAKPWATVNLSMISPHPIHSPLHQQHDQPARRAMSPPHHRQVQVVSGCLLDRDVIHFIHLDATNLSPSNLPSGTGPSNLGCRPGVGFRVLSSRTKGLNYAPLPILRRFPYKPKGI
jgi:hypothetical protein